MIFYKYTFTTNGDELERHEQPEKSREFRYKKTLEQEAVLCKEFCEELEDVVFYISNKGENFITVLCIYKGNLNNLRNLDKKANDLILHLDLDLLLWKRNELTLSDLIYELEKAQANNYIDNVREVRETHDLLIAGAWFKEKRMINVREKEELLNESKALIVENVLSDEIERIYQPKQDNSFGVPVHYLLNISNETECDKAINVLIDSMKNNARMIRNVYSVVDLTLKEKLYRLNPDDVVKLYKMNLGGVVVIKGNFKICEDDVFSDERSITEMFSEIMKRFSAEVTTILSCKHKSQENVFKEGLTDILLIQINDTTIRNNRAKQYLSNYAKGLNITNTTGLMEMVEEDVSYKPNDLIQIFTKWHKNYIKTIQYPQYAEFVGQEIKQKENDISKPAYNEMNNLVGLKGIKTTIEDYINYSKLQKVCAIEGGTAKNTCRHMCFVGNPGTAKTTVARYVAQVMKENGLLSSGQLIEVGRADIVSRFVGGTAPNVQQLFKKAVGNVLFIDEAYSLCEGKEGMYGDEAINAIVQEMENKREDLVVIFAGYKKEMEQFLERNSGLKSRIASIIEFPDYTEDELMEITKFQANKMDVDITLCEDKIKEILSIAKSKEKNFGNGRFVRNILEKARMKQATRLVAEDKLFGENLKILRPADFEMPKFEDKVKMGFC